MNKNYPSTNVFFYYSKTFQSLQTIIRNYNIKNCSGINQVHINLLNSDLCFVKPSCEKPLKKVFTSKMCIYCECVSTTTVDLSTLVHKFQAHLKSDYEHRSTVVIQIKSDHRMGKYDILHIVLTKEECDQLSNFNIFHSLHFCYICTFTKKNEIMLQKLQNKSCFKIVNIIK